MSDLVEEREELSGRNDPEYVLRGKTLKVYLYLLRHKQARGVSEVQHALGFSSPSIAVHHLDKLLRFDRNRIRGLQPRLPRPLCIGGDGRNRGSLLLRVMAILASETFPVIVRSLPRIRNKIRDHHT